MKDRMKDDAMWKEHHKLEKVLRAYQDWTRLKL